MAQTENTLRVVEGEASRVGDDVIVDMKLDLSNIEVGRNRTVVYRPLLMQGDSVAELPAIIVNGRVRHIQYQRLERAEDFLFSLGFADFRVRLFSGAARLQLPAEQLPRLLERRAEILSELKKTYSAVVLDLEVR